jgi:hypothetical protein
MISAGAMTLLGFEYLLRTHGVMADRLLGVTKPDEEEPVRGKQISDWLLCHGRPLSYVVIDDMDIEISGRHPFVRTNKDVGITEADAELAVTLLLAKG